MIKKKNDDKLTSAAKEFISSIDKTLDDKVWDQSFLLKNTRKHLNEIKDEVQQVLDKSAESLVEVEREKDSLQADHVKVYVSLYQQDGRSILKWQASLLALNSCSFGRPIYLEEEFARALIVNKGEPQEEGYVVVAVKDDDVLQMPEDKLAKDALGNPITVLKPGSLLMENVVEFVHYNNFRYRLINGKLVLKASSIVGAS